MTTTLACQPPPSVDEVVPVRGFSWVVADELAAMPQLGRLREVADDLEYLASVDITVLVSLTITPIDSDQLATQGITGRHIPVRDFTAPTIDQMIEFVSLVAETTTADERVGVHCTAGLGRSGTMAAANFVAQGLAPSEAIDEIRRLRPGSIETASQEQSIFEFAEFLSQDL